jgi:hypothetical protein
LRLFPNDYDAWWCAAEIINIFIFAETYEIPRLRLDAIDRLVWCYNHALHHHTEPEDFLKAPIFNHAYKHTKSGCVLRKWLVCAFRCFRNHDDRKGLLGLPKKFLVDFFQEWEVWADTNLEEELTACKFHRYRTPEAAKTCVVRVDMDVSGH